MSRTTVRVLVLLCLAVLAGCKGRGKVERRETLGEVEVVHSKVTVRGLEVRGVSRLGAGDELATSEDGRARLRLDDGTSVVIDRGTRLTVAADGVELGEGRVFVLGGEGAHTRVAAARLSTVAASSSLAVERRGDRATAYVASGEAVVRAGSKQEQVQSGETATASGDTLAVAPEKAFVDWTGGMAAPPAGARHGAVGDLSARSSNPEDPGTPLAVRAHDVDVRLHGEVAVTRVETTYFNGGAAAETGEFRISLPQGAILSRFAVRRGEQSEEGRVVAARESGETATSALAWAGSGWARGNVRNIPSGEPVAVTVEYVEWLSPARGRLTYRYPMTGDGPSPLLGEFHARVDLGDLSPKSLAVGQGAAVTGSVIEVRRADYRPQADLVVEAVEPRGFGAKDVRAYVVSAEPGDRSPDAYVLARADLPEAESSPGIALSLVVDASFSVSSSDLEAARAVVEALLEGLGPEDRLAVYAADQAVRPVGPEGAGPVDAARRKAVREALAGLSPGGASDLGIALERAAAALPADATAAMVVYVGDGWPTVGDTDMQAIRKRLARRARGVPRVGAVAVGASANRYGLAALAGRSSPVVSVVDRAEAAHAAVALLGAALEPAVEGLSIDLGAGVDRAYPRTEVAQPLGTTATLVGRVRGAMPKEAVLRYRKAGKLVEEKRPVTLVQAARADDVRRRWASARIDEISLEGIGLETAVDAAVKTALLTPWTAWAIGATSTVEVPPIAARVLELEGTEDVPVASRLAPIRPRRGAVLEPGDRRAALADLRAAVVESGRRTIEQAMASVRKCRDLRAALRPELTGTLDVDVSVDGAGHATKVHVRSTESHQDDSLLDRCVETVISNLVFFDSELAGALVFTHQLTLPPPRDPRKTQCSPASKLPLLVRRGIWRARLERADAYSAFLRARYTCEIGAAADHRALVDILLERVTDAGNRLELATHLEHAGEVEAAALLRRAAVRDASTPEELDAIRAILVAAEPVPGAELDAKYRAARTDAERLAVVRRFLRLAPHDPELRGLAMSLLEALGKKDELANFVYSLRQDPFADAALLADGASALRRAGRLEEGLRAFGEIIERAPGDPYARALVGDRLRDERLYDDAAAAYDALASLLPEDPAVSLRMALAHAGAGRLDVATRILARVTEGEGRSGDASLGELASIVTSVLLADAGKKGGPDAPALGRRALEVALPDVAGVVLVRTPALVDPVVARLSRGPKPKSKEDAFAQVEVPVALDAPSIGLSAARFERGDQALRLKLSRRAELAPGRPAKVRVDLLLLDEDRRPSKLVDREVDVLPDGKETVLEWNGEALL